MTAPRRKQQPKHPPEVQTGQRAVFFAPGAPGTDIMIFFFSSAGSSNSVIRMSLFELEKLSCAAGWVDVCKKAYD
jgi:hypothetical protein